MCFQILFLRLPGEFSSLLKVQVLNFVLLFPTSELQQGSTGGSGNSCTEKGASVWGPCPCLRSAHLPCLSSQGEIHRVKTDGSQRAVFAPLSLAGFSYSLALDWVSRNLYYTTSASRSIGVRLFICFLQIILYSKTSKAFFSP